MSDTTLFFQAIQAGEASKVKALLDSNPSLATVKNERGQSGVLLAAYSGRKEIRDLLLARDVTLELHEAAAAGQLERVQHLVEKDPALAKSYSPDGFPVFALALENGADPNYRYAAGYSPLITAAANGHLAIVSMLLGNGADLHVQTNDGKTALSFALERGHAAVAEFLRGSGAA